MSDVTLHPVELDKLRQMLDDGTQQATVSSLLQLYVKHGIRIEYLANVLHTTSQSIHALITQEGNFPAHLLGTTCVRGHERNPINTYIRSDGRADCRICRRKYLRTYYRNKKATAAS